MCDVGPDLQWLCVFVGAWFGLECGLKFLGKWAVLVSNKWMLTGSVWNPWMAFTQCVEYAFPIYVLVDEKQLKEPFSPEKETINVTGTIWHGPRRERSHLMPPAVQSGLSSDKNGVCTVQFCWQWITPCAVEKTSSCKCSKLVDHVWEFIQRMHGMLATLLLHRQA